MSLLRMSKSRYKLSLWRSIRFKGIYSLLMHHVHDSDIALSDRKEARVRPSFIIDALEVERVWYCQQG